MHPIIKKLAGQTAIYGLSTIAGRFLNYLLLPIHTYIFKDPADYGVITEFYAYVAFLNIIFSYGMETTFFRFVTSEPNKKRVYDTALASLLLTSLSLSGLLILLSQPIAHALLYPNHVEYIVWFTLILGLDAIVTIPFTRLRQENRPLRFAFYKVFNIAINVAFNLFFLILCPYILSKPGLSPLHDVVHFIYHKEIGVGYVFISNLIASGITVLMLWRYFYVGKWEVNWGLWKKMMSYALPLVIVGMAGMVDEMLSRAILKYRLQVSHDLAMHELGVFGANYKLAVLMTLYIQAFRMAAEPFFFNESHKVDARLTYAKTMNYFVIGGGFIFLGVTLFMDLFKAIFISPAYYEGIKVVPILLMAQLFLGVYYNLTIWYKLTNKTRLGAIVAIYGAAITFALNWWWIPDYSYVGSSWVTFICYGSMVIISYFLGQKFFPVPYMVSRFLIYIILASILFFIGTKLYSTLPSLAYYAAAIALLGIYASIVYVIETGKVRFLKAI